MRSVRLVIGSILLSGALVANHSERLVVGPTRSDRVRDRGRDAHPGDRLRVQPRQPDDARVRPGQPARRRPDGVALHGCTQSASTYHAGSGWSQLADEGRFAVIHPQTSSGNNATSMINAFGCMNAPPNKTPAQWGDLARQSHPGFAGTRPKVAIWHGAADSTVVPANATELVDQFTDVAGVSQTPTATANLPGGTTRTSFGDDDVVRYSVQGMGHGTPVDPGEPTDPTDPVDPDPGECVTASSYAHTVAGRAHQSGGHAFANGSNEDLGLWNVFTTSELEETSPGHWALGC